MKQRKVQYAHHYDDDHTCLSFGPELIHSKEVVAGMKRGYGRSPNHSPPGPQTHDGRCKGRVGMFNFDLQFSVYNLPSSRSPLIGRILNAYGRRQPGIRPIPRLDKSGDITRIMGTR
jgi:hypothetical protein